MNVTCKLREWGVLGFSFIFFALSIALFTPFAASAHSHASTTELKVVKYIRGGTASVNDFHFFIDGTEVAHDQFVELPIGTYIITETGPAGYVAVNWSGNCTDQGDHGETVVGPEDIGEYLICTIENDFVGSTTPPTPTTTPSSATLTLVKHVINDNGGTSTVSDFPLFVGTTTMTSGVSKSFAPGTYTVSETQKAGYTASVWSGDCAAGGSITLASGGSYTCHITNNDNATTTGGGPGGGDPGGGGGSGTTTASLTVIKHVINDNSGTATTTDFPLFVGTTSVTSGVAQQFALGTYTVSETNLAGYTAGAWGGDCAADGTITLSATTTSYVCEITNNDDGGNGGNNGGGGDGDGDGDGNGGPILISSGSAGNGGGNGSGNGGGEIAGASDQFGTGGAFPLGAPNTGFGSMARSFAADAMMLLALLGIVASVGFIYATRRQTVRV